jgi:WhiB family transcriptional regulator, redox-sensing transcriptional regulator
MTLHDDDDGSVLHEWDPAAIAAFLGQPTETPRWHRDAVCAQADPEAFFPERGGSTAAAKRVCQGCPVRAECLEYALANDERFGVWGGLSERERRRIQRGAAAAGEAA